MAFISRHKGLFFALVMMVMTGLIAVVGIKTTAASWWTWGGENKRIEGRVTQLESDIESLRAIILEVKASQGNLNTSVTKLVAVMPAIKQAALTYPQDDKIVIQRMIDLPPEDWHIVEKVTRTEVTI